MTVSLPEELKERILAEAQKDNRKASNWLVTKLNEWMKDGPKLLF